tara:strand:+ start:57474 stop:57722 length:249 start_codon:yes stop_codon:yes gene_type:complete
MKVKVFTKNDDPYSQMVKNLLQSNNVEFENIEVSRNTESFKEMVGLSGQESTPVLVIDEKVFCGFDRELIKSVLNFSKDETE